MKICVYGAGAVGGHIAGRLGMTDATVSLVARGEQLAAIEQNGLRVLTRDGELFSRPAASASPTDLGVQDVVIVTVKAPSLASVAVPMSSLLDLETRVVFAVNGIPWWYRLSPLEGVDGRLPRLDPDGALQAWIGEERAVGAVAYTASTVVGPGVVRAENPRNRLIVGRPDGTADPVLDELAAMLTPTGLEVTVTPRIRDAVWAKLMMNLVGGALGVLTASPMKDVLDKPAVAAQARAMADEGAAIARAYGCDPGNIDEGLSRLSTSGHVQSIVQDLLAGRPMEIDALFRAPLDLAARADVATPHLSVVTDLAIQRAVAAGLY